jgi:hypothetical protein
LKQIFLLVNGHLSILRLFFNNDIYMTRIAIIKAFATIAGLFATLQICAQDRQAPAYPLIMHNTYFSIWSTTDQLNASTTQHWTGADNSLLGLINVDGRIFRFMGKAETNYRTIVKASDEAGYSVRYSETQPPGNWMMANFNDGNWRSGQAPIGDNEKTAKTNWRSNHIWVRRSFTITNLSGINEFFLKLDHDDNIEVFLNGKKIYNKVGWTSSFQYHPINKADLKVGQNIIAIHLENTAGGRFLDFGLVDKVKDNTDNIALAEQKHVEVTATQTIYDFTCGHIDLKLTCTSPLLLNDMKLLARPVSYVTYGVQANDEKKHNVKIFLGASSNIAVYQPTQEVSARKYTAGGLSILKTGTIEQPILQKGADDMRIDWGFFYVAVPQSFGAVQFITKSSDAARAFSNGLAASTASTGKLLSLNTVIPMGAVGKDLMEREVLLGYDELYSIQYFNTNLRPWWNNDGKQTIEGQLAEAAKDYKTVMATCAAFNKELYNVSTKAGGNKYAHLCALAYRQSIAAHTLVKSPAGEMLWLSKENNSGGFINTVDVTYPSAPLYLLYNPKLVEGMLNGIFHFSETGQYAHPWAAHDLGTYPVANGQTYGEPMPVEESGNMIILTAAIAKMQGNTNYAKLHWKTLTTWVDYLTKEGLDPKTQLCTDDFAGHLARNANLSVKAIVAIACYAQLAEALGETATAKKYRAIAESMVPQWIQMADAGDHYSLTFDNKETWSQKYNLVWDKVLNLHLFPQKVYDTETQYYLTKQQPFGLPLDSRKTYTKNDWILWTATFAPQQDQFEKLITPVYRHALETGSRVPLNDFYDAITGIRENFKARSVVGGFFMKMLADSMQGK